MKYFILKPLVIIGLCLFSCKSNQLYTPETYEKDQIVFGNSGGFAGHTTSYILLDNGQFFYKAPRKRILEEMRPVESKLVDQIFSNYEELGFKKMVHNDPGNLTYFIEYISRGQKQRLVWGGNAMPLDQNLEIFFRNLSQLAKSQNAIKAPSKTEEK